MYKYPLIIALIFTISNCSLKSGITEKMKIGLISFEQTKIEYQVFLKNDTINGERYQKGKIIKKINNNIFTISYFTKEVGCPTFEGGYLINGDILTLYYQDVNFKPVDCVDFFELKYKISISNTKYDKINIVRLNPIKK